MNTRWLGTMAIVSTVVVMFNGFRSWAGWRRFAPLLAIVLAPVGVVMGQIVGSVDVSPAIGYTGFLLLGYVIVTGESAPTLSRSHAFRLLSALILLIILITSTLPARAEDFYVNSAASLISAINAANTNETDDVIILTANITLSAVNNGDNGLPIIGGDNDHILTIQGNGFSISRSTAPGTPDFRIFSVHPSANLVINDLTIANGRCGDCNGGGIHNSGRLTLTHVNLNNNYAALSGGGIRNAGGLTLTNVAFNNNSADDSGGGMAHNTSNLFLLDVIFNGNSAYRGGGLYSLESNPTLTNVTFNDNVATLGAGMYNGSSSPGLTNVFFSDNAATAGGGMHNFQSSPTLTNVTFSSNSALDLGGGMYNFQGIPTLTNVTFSGNSARIGGGMYNSNSNLTMINATFSDNTATDSGGGIRNSNSSPTLKNVIIANSLNGGDCTNLSSTINVNSSNNLIEDAVNNCGLENSINGNIVGVDPKLGPLADNGGLTQTHLPQPGSPIIDAGTDLGAPATDQRGVSRPQGAAFDIGAVEVHDSDFVYVAYLPLVTR